MSAGLQQYEICPNCGEFVDVLSNDTGWCIGCSPNAPTCIRCGGPTDIQLLCRSCRADNWLQNHADEIEVFIYMGLSTRSAIKAVNNRLEDICIICGDSFKAKPQAEVLICTARKTCRTAKRSYKYFVYEKLMSKDKATVLVKEKYAITNTVKATAA